MTGDRIAEKAIADFLAMADVVNDKVAHGVFRSFVDDDADVCDTTPEVPRNNVARLIIACVC